MLTKWGRKLSSFPLGNGQIGGIPYIQTTNDAAYGKAYVPAKDANNDSYYALYKPKYVGTGLLTSYSTGNGGIAVGSGNTPATEDDYCLESIINSLTGSSSGVSSRYNSDKNCFETIVTLTLNNSTDSDVTVKEVGLFAVYNAGVEKGATSLSAKCFMFDRTVLAEPIVVPAGESSVFRYTFSYPTFDDPV